MNQYDDTITIFAKTKKLSEIINIYKNFGWKLTTQKENSRYQDIVDLTFTRPHKIHHKDELQLHQVYMEDKLNSLAKLEKYRYSKTIILSLSYGILGLLFLVLGLLANFQVTLGLGLVESIISIIIGIALWTIGVLKIPKIHKKQNEIFNNKSKILKSEILSIITIAKKLSGGEYNEEQ